MGKSVSQLDHAEAHGNNAHRAVIRTADCDLLEKCDETCIGLTRVAKQVRVDARRIVEALYQSCLGTSDAA